MKQTAVMLTLTLVSFFAEAANCGGKECKPDERCWLPLEYGADTQMVFYAEHDLPRIESCRHQKGVKVRAPRRADLPELGILGSEFPSLLTYNSEVVQPFADYANFPEVEVDAGRSDSYGCSCQKAYEKVDDVVLTADHPLVAPFMNTNFPFEAQLMAAKMQNICLHPDACVYGLSCNFPTHNFRQTIPPFYKIFGKCGLARDLEEVTSVDVDDSVDNKDAKEAL